MFNILTTKTKLQHYSLKEIPLNSFEVIGIGQINPNCKKRYENELFLTVVTILNDSKKYDEKEGLIASEYFTLRKCPKCHKEELIPTKLILNMYPKYIKNEQDYIYNPEIAYKSKYTIPSVAFCMCNNCNTCYQIHIKSSDMWYSEAKKIKEKDLILPWDEYDIS